ncbi:MAG: hypothetical protein JW874_02150 [Spirochaetales bacterium]|nr:hypothetical protein [Spirochaetales bacterium]
MVTMTNKNKTQKESGRDLSCAINLSASYYYKDWQSCVIIDVSSIGATIRTRQILMKGDTITLRIVHGDWTASVNMTVTYQSGPKIWLSFMEYNTDERAFFLELVNKVLYEKVRDRVKNLSSQ